jgi:hypothetical protein
MLKQLLLLLLSEVQAKAKLLVVAHKPGLIDMVMNGPSRY